MFHFGEGGGKGEGGGNGEKLSVGFSKPARKTSSPSCASRRDSAVSTHCTSDALQKNKSHNKVSLSDLPCVTYNDPKHGVNTSQRRNTTRRRTIA